MIDQKLVDEVLKVNSKLTREEAEKEVALYGHRAIRINERRLLPKCKECDGQGNFTYDEHDPSSDYGHGQREEECEACGGTGIAQ